jgi:hypothetical protein
MARMQRPSLTLAWPTVSVLHPPSERLKNEFLFLKPSEEETWRGSVDGTPVKPGKYQIVGAYVPDFDQVHELVGLPEAQGLLIADVVRSTAVTITIE